MRWPARSSHCSIEASFHPHSSYELGKLRGLGGRMIEVHASEVHAS